MRLWSIHPVYLDSKGLVALWREGLLAQKVLLGRTKGYKNHPQLARFKNTDDPLSSIACYLRYIADEARKRNYNFNKNKIVLNNVHRRIEVTTGQLEYEFRHLLDKLKTRDQDLYRELKTLKQIMPHPLFKSIVGDTEEWEIIPAKDISSCQIKNQDRSQQSR